MAIPGHALPFGPFNQSCWSPASMSKSRFGLHFGHLAFSSSLTEPGSILSVHGAGVVGENDAGARIGRTRLARPRTRAATREGFMSNPYTVGFWDDHYVDSSG